MKNQITPVPTQPPEAPLFVVVLSQPQDFGGGGAREGAARARRGGEGPYGHEGRMGRRQGAGTTALLYPWPRLCVLAWERVV